MTTTDTVVDDALPAATRAPSVHNTRPWRCVVAPPRLELHLDCERILPVAEPTAREARISCGAALVNLRAALRAAGVSAVVEPEEKNLAAAIGRRATDRRPFPDRPVPPRHRTALVRAAQAERAHLFPLDTPRALDTLDTLPRRAGHLQEEHPAFQRELRGWTDEATGRDDGVPRSAGGPRPVGGTLLTPRRFPTGAALERSFEADPLVAVLTTHGDGERDQVRAGLAVQRVLVTAAAVGLSTSSLSQPVEVPATGAALRNLPEVHGVPQTVLRVGHGYPARTPRRPVAAVATTAHRDGVPS